jgi:hypothetical protein
MNQQFSNRPGNVMQSAMFALMIASGVVACVCAAMGG